MFNLNTSLSSHSEINAVRAAGLQSCKDDVVLLQHQDDCDMFKTGMNYGLGQGEAVHADEKLILVGTVHNNLLGSHPFC